MKIAQLLLFTSLFTTAACASSDAVPESEGEEAGDVSGASDADITSGASAKLTKVTYKKTVPVAGSASARCTYDISWLTVSNLSSSVRTALNTALYYGPKKTDLACEDPGGEVEGGYSKVSVNSSGVLSLAYGHYQMSNGAAHPNTFVTPINLNLSTGKWITLADILTAEGKKTLIDGCAKQWKAHATAEGEADFAQDGSVCEGALTLGTNKTEAFTIEKDGLRVHVDNQLPHAIAALAGEGFLVTWSELGTGVKAGSAVKGFAKR